MRVSETVAHRPVVIDNLLDHIGEARGAVEDVFARARAAVGRDVPEVTDAEQHRLHALAWLATYTETLRSLAGYAERLEHAGRFGETEQLLVQIAFGEYLAQVAGGIPMNQQEFARLADLGVGHDDAAPLHRGGAGAL